MSALLAVTPANYVPHRHSVSLVSLVTFLIRHASLHVPLHTMATQHHNNVSTVPHYSQTACNAQNQHALAAVPLISTTNSQLLTQGSVFLPVLILFTITLIAVCIVSLPAVSVLHQHLVSVASQDIF